MRELSRGTEADLAALADGSLSPEHRAEVAARAESSPELGAELGRQRRALALLRSAEVQAPQSLHSYIESLIASKESRRRAGARPRRLLSLPALGGGALALAGAIALVLLATGGGSGKPGVSEAFAFTLRGANRAAPARSAGNPAELRLSVQGIPFPYWGERFGWRASGARVDSLGGHRVTTVFYSNAAGRRIGYAILSGPALEVRGGAVQWRGGVGYRLLESDGVPVVTWTRAGHVCVISGRAVSARLLLELASWTELGASRVPA